LKNGLRDREKLVGGILGEGRVGKKENGSQRQFSLDWRDLEKQGQRRLLSGSFSRDVDLEF
jgi:hypothetical protein